MRWYEGVRSPLECLPEQVSKRTKETCHVISHNRNLTSLKMGSETSLDKLTSVHLDQYDGLLKCLGHYSYSPIGATSGGSGKLGGGLASHIPSKRSQVFTAPLL